MVTPKEAEAELECRAVQNPGAWVRHSISVAQNGRLIADKF